MNGWIAGGGPHNEIILSSRIRLARNISDIPFPSALEDEDAKKVVKMLKEGFSENGIFPEDYKYIEMKSTNLLEKQVLIERHVISPALVKHSDSGAAIIKNDEIVSIMINEEDHIRIQSILPGLQIKKAMEIANEADDKIEQNAEYAYDEKWGYLTSCPTNVGTGMRASVMIHLPALNITGNISRILQAVTQIGLTFRGLYGEGTEVIGNIFQISNQITLGRSEEEIVDNLTAVTNQIIEKEKEARGILLNNNRILIEDRIWRAWGTMNNARIMRSQECMKLLSDIRLGVDLGIINHIPISALNEIMIDTQPAGIQKQADAELTDMERDILRAEAIRKKLT